MFLHVAAVHVEHAGLLGERVPQVPGHLLEAKPDVVQVWVRAPTLRLALTHALVVCAVGRGVRLVGLACTYGLNLVRLVVGVSRGLALTGSPGMLVFASVQHTGCSRSVVGRQRRGRGQGGRRRRSGRGKGRWLAWSAAAMQRWWRERQKRWHRRCRWRGKGLRVRRARRRRWRRGERLRRAGAKSPSWRRIAGWRRHRRRHWRRWGLGPVQEWRRRRRRSGTHDGPSLRGRGPSSPYWPW
mmetsp:Transcript_2440/g.8083  ORF Transcript_2440/g.8083 Transcript_2440/m.8083 type:complete len:241 (+) Transcript_2440:1298-2020(+)